MVRAKGVTIRDVARRAGVSIAAVSMALNDTGTLSAGTRVRVRAVAASMEYEADALARGLRGSSVGVVGLVVRSLDALGEYAPSGVDVFSRYIGAISSLAMDRGLSLMLVPDLTRRPAPPLALSLDGYVVLSPHRDDPVIAILERREIPYVTLGRDVSRPGFTDWAAEDDATMIPRVLNHLVSGGARHTVLVTGTDSNAWNIDADMFYRRWCSERGLTPQVYNVPEAEGVFGGERVGDLILASGIPDAVLCVTGRHSAGVLNTLQARGITVPERTMVATASDSEHTRQSHPAISAIELNPSATSAALLDLLQDRMSGLPSTGPILTASRFRPRASTRREPLMPLDASPHNV
ncbi:LacI family DNA-binding transcriptional regulator [Subtercola lobariae]|uniref:LacI family transcriptional regulator n=1 Tax=Subtercola lobariae TaxID=1588641 RepID=A0A917B4Y7_9MICO|nr:LacI family DNA-binding transcriptional regulator [Subtercola lobariae]GGF19312.1 LacI family transcriptional regulator [Subtercola lobariae]